MSLSSERKSAFLPLAVAVATFIFGNMTAAEKWDLISAAEHLAGEAAADEKH